MLEWYIPWNMVDNVLRIQIALWLLSVVGAYFIAWRTLVAKKPWLRKRDDS